MNLANNLERWALLFPDRPAVSELPKSAAGKILKREIRRQFSKK